MPPIFAAVRHAADVAFDQIFSIPLRYMKLAAAAANSFA
jgi:hypothetical protein